MVRLAMSVAVAVVVACCAAGCGSSGTSAADAVRGERERRPRAGRLRAPAAHVDRNRGQTDGRVRFRMRRAPATPSISPATRIALTLQRRSGKGVALALRFLGADPAATPAGDRRARGTANYLVGDDPARWRTRVPGYLGVVCRDLFAGIDLKLSGPPGERKYEFRVRRPGEGLGHPARLSRRHGPAARRGRGAAGRHRAGRAARLAAGATRTSAARGKPVRSRFALNDDRGYGFAVGRYDRGRELVIDPSLVLLDPARRLERAGTRVAASQTDGGGQRVRNQLHAVAELPDHDRGSFDRTGSATNNMDAFVSKLNPAGTALVYSTFLGGVERRSGAVDLAVDSAGNAYVTGKTMSSNFPTTSGAFDRDPQRRQLPALRHRPDRRLHRQAEPGGLRPRLLDLPGRHEPRRDIRHRDRRRPQRVRDGRDDRPTSRRRPAPSTPRPAATPTPTSPSSTRPARRSSTPRGWGGADNRPARGRGGRRGRRQRDRRAGRPAPPTPRPRPARSTGRPAAAPSERSTCS